MPLGRDELRERVEPEISRANPVHVETILADVGNGMCRHHHPWCCDLLVSLILH